MRLFLNCNHISTCVWLIHLDLSKKLEEKGRCQLHKDAACCFKQILKAEPCKIAAVHPLASHQVRQTRYAGCYWRSKNELISNVLLCTPIHGHVNASQPAKN